MTALAILQFPSQPRGNEVTKTRLNHFMTNVHQIRIGLLILSRMHLAVMFDAFGQGCCLQGVDGKTSGLAGF